MTALQQKMGLLANKLVQVIMESGLSWDESVAALGLAAKALAATASVNGDGCTADCVAHARRRFDEAFAQDIKVIMACSDISQLRAAYCNEEIIHANNIVKIALPH